MVVPAANEQTTSEATAVLLIDHGSRRAAANALLDEVAALVKRRLGPESIVEPAHMEIAEPTIADRFARCVEQGATAVVVHPFMLAPGRHVTEDLPRLVAEAAARHQGVRFSMAAPLGSHSGVIDAVIERCQSALPDPEPSAG
ncbi:MAG: cobalamin biosynthesis protein CbiX [Deltaproteobacteria bacterium]|nr:cobalamin biosynthesis protein CbiX [Deltaproteobacteria bacterium]